MKQQLLTIALVILGAFALVAIAAPRLPAAPPAGESALSEAQQAVLTAALAEKKSYAEIVRQARAAGMDCTEIAWFLCNKAGNDRQAVYEIVYAAVTGGCDAEQVVSGALRAGAPLQTVVQAARAAGASREAIAAAAGKAGYTAMQISSAFAGTTGAGEPGGTIGDGAIFGGPVVGSPILGGPLGGGAIGGGAGGKASPHKP